MSTDDTASPNYFRFRCVCNWGVECFNLKKLLDEAGDDLLTRMIPIKSGASDLSISLRSAVKLHFKLGPEDDGLDFYVAAHHWTPSLISKNYEGSKGNRPSRQFKTLLTLSEARSHDWSMSETVNNFESCMRRAGVSVPRTDERRHFIVQAPINPRSRVRSYFQALTGRRAVRLRERILEDEKREPLAVPEAVSSASPLVFSSAVASPLVFSSAVASPLAPSSAVAAVASSPDLSLPSVSTYQKHIREQQLKWNFKRNSNPKFLQCFQMLRTFCYNFDEIECATVPTRVFLYPCRSDARSDECLQYAFRYRPWLLWEVAHGTQHSASGRKVQSRERT
jgi:hypothetical protein